LTRAGRGVAGRVERERAREREEALRACLIEIALGDDEEMNKCESGRGDKGEFK
jgi:hypothetical protein